jgi:hypothetical protein
MRAPFAAAGGIYATTTVPLVAHGHAAPRRVDGCCGASPWKRFSVSQPSGTTSGSEPDFWPPACRARGIQRTHRRPSLSRSSYVHPAHLPIGIGWKLS